MKKYIFFAAILISIVLLSINSRAQKPETGEKNTKEIIIRKNGDKNTKMTIEINGDSIIVNGKPLSDYRGDDVTVMEKDLQRDFLKGHLHNLLISPENDEDVEINAFDNDMENNMENAGSRTFLGVVTEKATDGVKITNVIKGSAAEKAGLQKDDIITQLNDRKIISPGDLMEAVRSYKPADHVKIDYLRNNKKKDVKVTLGETKERNREFFFKDDNHSMNGNGFNFNMPQMPKMPNLPNYKYKFWNNSNPKVGIKIEDTENGNGATILTVEEGSAADKAGLKRDDIITEINGEKVNNVDEIKEQLDEADSKESLNLKAKRNNAEMNFEVKIPKQRNSADL